MAEPAKVPRVEGYHEASEAGEGPRAWVSRVFTCIEDLVYIGLGALLAGSAVVLLGAGIIDFARDLGAGQLPTTVVALLDRILLILMIVEILYTVQVSFREHTLIPEPFLIVGLIAATRRVLANRGIFTPPGARRDGVPQRHDRAGPPHDHDRGPGGLAADAPPTRRSGVGRPLVIFAVTTLAPT